MWMRTAVLLDAGYSAVSEPLMSADRPGRRPEPPGRPLHFLDTLIRPPGPPPEPGAAEQPQRVPGPRSSVSPPVQHLDPDQVEVMGVESEKRTLSQFNFTDWMTESNT